MAGRAGLALAALSFVSKNKENTNPKQNPCACSWWIWWLGTVKCWPTLIKTEVGWRARNSTAMAVIFAAENWARRTNCDALCVAYTGVTGLVHREHGLERRWRKTWWYMICMSVKSVPGRVYVQVRFENSMATDFTPQRERSLSLDENNTSISCTLLIFLTASGRLHTCALSSCMDGAGPMCATAQWRGGTGRDVF